MEEKKVCEICGGKLTAGHKHICTKCYDDMFFPGHDYKITKNDIIFYIICTVLLITAAAVGVFTT